MGQPQNSGLLNFYPLPAFSFCQLLAFDGQFSRFFHVLASYKKRLDNDLSGFDPAAAGLLAAFVLFARATRSATAAVTHTHATRSATAGRSTVH
jgi:hypothetical protein